MQDNNLKPLIFPLAFFVATIILLTVTGTMYLNRSNDYKAPKANTSTARLVATNPEVLLNWMPKRVYDFTVSRLQDYVNNNGSNYSTLTFDSVSIDEAKYKFNVTMNPGDSIHTVTVEPTNYDGAITAAVSVDGTVQGVTSSDNVDGSGFIGFDTLTDQGLTAYQYKGLQQAFSTFDNNLKYVAVDTDTLINSADTNSDPTAKLYFTFAVSIDGKEYSAKADYWDITKVRLYLYDTKSQKQVFDSGDIDSSQ